MGRMQARMAEVRDLGKKFGCNGAESGSRIVNILLLNTICISKQVFYTWKKLIKSISLVYFFQYIQPSTFIKTSLPCRNACGLQW